MPAFAQTQGHPPHPGGRPHDPATHHPLDPAAHAALHALLHGSWSGDWSSTHATATKLELAVGTDRNGKPTLTIKTAGEMKAGAASEVAIDSHGLHWTQPLMDTSCKATAALEQSAHHSPATMKGTMTCGTREMVFVLHKTKA